MDCGYSLEPPRQRSRRRGGSNEYPQSMFLSRNKKHNVYPCKPQFYYIKVGFKGSKLYRYVFVMSNTDGSFTVADSNSSWSLGISSDSARKQIFRGI